MARARSSNGRAAPAIGAIAGLYPATRAARLPNRSPAHGMTTRPGEDWDVLRSRVFLGGQAVSMLGDGLAILAIPLLVLQVSRSPVLAVLASLPGSCPNPDHRRGHRGGERDDAVAPAGPGAARHARPGHSLLAARRAIGHAGGRGPGRGRGWPARRRSAAGIRRGGGVHDPDGRPRLVGGVAQSGHRCGSRDAARFASAAALRRTRSLLMHGRKVREAVGGRSAGVGRLPQEAELAFGISKAH